MTKPASSTTDSVIELTDPMAKDFVKTHPIVFVDVYASWCGTCRLFAPHYEKAASEHKDIVFTKLDGEKNPLFSFVISPESIPYVAVFVNGELVGGKVCGKKEILD